jgi:hypothetical protein
VVVTVKRGAVGMDGAVEWQKATRVVSRYVQDTISDAILGFFDRSVGSIETRLGLLCMYLIQFLRPRVGTTGSC